MTPRYAHLALVSALAAGGLAGCLFDSRSPAADDPVRERYTVLGHDSDDVALEMDFAPELYDSGLTFLWTETPKGKPAASRFAYLNLDSAGYSKSEGQESYPVDTVAYFSPRISAFPFHGTAQAWIEAGSGPLPANAVYALLEPSPLGRGNKERLAIGNLHEAHALAVLALPDTGFVIGASGADSSGGRGIWIQRFDDRMRPVGEAWFLPSTSTHGAPELARLPEGGWMAAWIREEGGRNEVAWQAFDAEGHATGATRSRAAEGLIAATCLRLEPLPGARILVQARTGTLAPFVLGKDGEAEATPPFPQGQAATHMAADLRHDRLYGILQGKLARMDFAFRVQATRGLPGMVGTDPAVAVLPSGKIALIDHGDATRPPAERRAFLTRIIDPF
jgi:hypothetical protein